MVSIRPLEHDDRQKIRRLLEESKTFPEHEIAVALELIEETLNAPARSCYQIYCADEAGRLAGYICFGRISMTDACFDLYWIAVDRDMSRHGVGSQLMAFMENAVREQGARRVYVETSSLPAFAAARAFYKKQHYELVSILTDFYRIGDHKMVFVKDLHPLQI